VQKNSISELPFATEKIKGFLPGTHQIVYKEGLYDVDHQKITALPNIDISWWHQWVFAAAPNLLVFSFTHKAVTAFSSASEPIPILATENIQNVKCQPLKPEDQKILLTVHVASTCIPINFGLPTTSSYDKEMKGKKTIVSFTKDPFSSGPPRGLRIIYSTYDFEPNYPEFEVDLREPYFTQYASKETRNILKRGGAVSGTTLMDINGTKAFFAYEWLRSLHPPRLTLEKRVVVPYENTYVAFLYRAVVGSGGNIIELQKVLDSKRYPISLAGLAEFDHFIQSVNITSSH
jgi:hypothetical protein